MKSGTHELGAQPAFLASCVSRSPVSFSSPEKKFRIFNSDTYYSVTIKDGMGYFSILNQRTAEYANKNIQSSHLASNSDIIPSDLGYDDFFEVENGEATSCDYSDLVERGIVVYKYLIDRISQLYCTKVANLHLAFAITLSNNDIPKSDFQNLTPGTTSNQDHMLTLTDVFSCIIEENDYYPLFKMVPDGCDLISQLAITFSRYQFKSDHCLCFKAINQICPQAALSSTLKYKLSELFFDCKKIDELYVYIKRIIEDINEENLLQPVSLCPTCYNAYMVFESKRIKTAQLLAKYSRDFYQNKEEEKRLKKMKALRKSEIRNVKKKSAHGCGSNLSFQERRVMLIPNNSLLIAGRQTVKPVKKTSTSINNFSKTTPMHFNRKENVNMNKNQSANNDDPFALNVGKPGFSSTLPMPETKMNI